MNEAWYVYIAEARTGRFYVGITKNPENRIKQHNAGAGSKFAREQGPFQLCYVSGIFPNKSSARLREVQLKGWSREKKKKLIDGLWN